MEKKRIFVINVGSTSTKLALFEDEQYVVQESVREPDELIVNSLTCMDQLEGRRKTVGEFIARNAIDMNMVDMIAARGGSTEPCQGGAYAVNQLMVDTLRYAPATHHPSSLSPVLGSELAEKYDIPCIIYDAISTDETTEIARISGIPEITNNLGAHILNPRAVGHKVARQRGTTYAKSRFIIAHMGGGISVSAHMYGKIVDYADEYMGPMSPERAGCLPNVALVKLCYSNRYTQDEMLKHISGRGGLLAYLGTSDCVEIERRIRGGDEWAALHYEAMCYQIARKIAEISAVFCGRVDAIILTGALAHSDYIVSRVRERVEFIAPIEVVAGEMEMEALAGGALRVLRGEEAVKAYDIVPTGYDSVEAFYRALADGRVKAGPNK